MKRKLKWIFAAMFVFGPSIAIADKLSDFTDAVSKTGCESIPYSYLRTECNSQQRYVHDWCDGAKGPVTCGSEGITRRLKDALAKEKSELEELKDKKTKLEDQKSHASEDAEKDRLGKKIEAVEKDIYEQSKLTDQAIANLDARKKLVEDAIYTIDKCIDYRSAVMNIFATTQDKVRGESDPDIVPIARQLRDKYEETKGGHKEAITGKTNALETCKDSMP
jgi:hypothetical protein